MHNDTTISSLDLCTGKLCSANNNSNSCGSVDKMNIQMEKIVIAEGVNGSDLVIYGSLGYLIPIRLELHVGLDWETACEFMAFMAFVIWLNSFGVKTK